MANPVLGPDRVLLLLSLVPYLREHGPVPVSELAETFGVAPELLRSLVRFLGTAGVPGETLSYQDQDLFDIDWDALEEQDLVSLTRTVAVEDAPRFAPAETAALVAGLHALTAVLPPADAVLARETAAKLGAALGAAGAPTVSVSADPEDERVARLVSAIERGQTVGFRYRDAAGAESERTVEPRALTQGPGGWYLRGICLDRGAERTFRVDQIFELRAEAPGAPEAPEAPESPTESTKPAAPAVPTAPAAPSEPAAASPVTRITARVSAAALPRIAGFAPTVIDEPAPGSVRVEVEAWHADAAIRLVQLAPGEISVEAPAAARDAVRSWTARALAAYGE